jgi:hypothetical protein
VEIIYKYCVLSLLAAKTNATWQVEEVAEEQFTMSFDLKT